MRTQRKVVSWVVATVLASHCACCLQPHNIHTPWREAEVDYSAANEYVRAHYFAGEDDDRSYFWQPGCSVEPIYNARKGVLLNGVWEKASLEGCGFTLCHAPSAVTDFQDFHQIQTVYLPELRRLITSCFDQKVSHIIFWQPMFRGDDCVITARNEESNAPPTANVAANVHIDSDIGAFGLDGLLKLVKNNRIAENEKGFTEESSIQEALENGRRFAIVNAWRNADRDFRVGRSPLAILLPNYASSGLCFPHAAPDEDESKWYTFPHMTPNECILFKQYDRNVQRPSDLWHCALRDVIDDNAPPRESFDVRALVVFEEVVAPELDRLGAMNRKSLLTYEESGCFCDEQARDRGISSSTINGP